MPPPRGQLIKNVKVIAREECVSQHQLLVGDIIISGAPQKRRNAHTKAERMEAEKNPM